MPRYSASCRSTRSSPPDRRRSHCRRLFIHGAAAGNGAGVATRDAPTLRGRREAGAARGRCSRSSVAAARRERASAPPRWPRSPPGSGGRCWSSSTCSATAGSTCGSDPTRHRARCSGCCARPATGERALGELLERWLVAGAGWPPVLLAPARPGAGDRRARPARRDPRRPGRARRRSTRSWSPTSASCSHAGGVGRGRALPPGGVGRGRRRPALVRRARGAARAGLAQLDLLLDDARHPARAAPRRLQRRRRPRARSHGRSSSRP